MSSKPKRRLLGFPSLRIGRRTEGRRGDGIATAKNRAFIQLNDLGWRAGVFDGEGALQDEILAEAHHLPEAEQSDRLIRVLERALQALRGRQRTALDSISLVVDDPSVVIVDNRNAAIASESDDAVREFGVQLLGRSDPAFGWLPFGVSSERETERRVYGFIESDRIKKYLASFNELAVKVTGIIPEPMMLLREALSQTEQPYFGMSIAGASTTIIVANGQFGAATARTIPVGVYTLVGAVARSNRISWDEAYQGMVRRDCFAGVDPGAPAETPEGEVPPSVNARALAGPLGLLREQIRETLEFFAVQRAGGSPRQLQLHGEVTALKGFQAWLEAILGLPILRSDRDAFALPVEEQRGASFNLLKGAAGSLITIGKVNYRFDKDRFWPDPDDLKKPGASIVRGPDRRKADQGRFPDRRANDRRSGGKAKSPGVFETVLSPERRYAALMLMMLFGAWLAIDENLHTPDRVRFERALDGYENALMQHISLRRKMASGAVSAAAARRRGDTRVLWAERLINAAGHLRTNMWLRSVDLSTVVIRERKKATLAKTLSITTGLSGSSENHVGEIAAFMDALDGDPVFMRDFRQIVFEEAAVHHGKTDKTVEFTVHARTSPDVPSRGSRPENSALGDVLRSPTPGSDRLRSISGATGK